MVTKVKNNQGLLFSGNFAPRGVAGLVISHSGGAVTGDGAIVETVAGTVAVPANTTWTVYASLTTGLLVAAATSAVPTTNALPLWHGVSGSAGTTLIDIRSWASTMIQISPATRGFNEYLTDTYTLDHDWRFQHTSGASVEDFGGLTDYDLTTSNTPEVVPNATGDSVYDGDIATEMTTLFGAQMANTSTVSFTHTAGHVGIVLKTPGDGTGSGMALAYGNSSTSSFMFFRPSTLGRFDFGHADPTNSVNVVHRLVGADWLDDAYHLFVVEQKGDGTGVNMYVDGSLLPTIQNETYNGTGDADSWFHDSPTAGRVAVGSAAALGNNLLEGEYARVWISPDTVTAVEMETLNDARSGLVV